MLSYSKGPDAPLLQMTIAEAFGETAQRFPDNLALVSRHQNTRLTFAELNAEVERTARGLAGLGLRADDRVGVWSTNCIEWILLHLACTRIGAVLVNVNPAYRAFELAFVLRKSGMKALFLWERDSRSDYQAIFEEAAAGAARRDDADLVETLAQGRVCERGIERGGEPLGDLRRRDTGEVQGTYRPGSGIYHTVPVLH